MDPNEPIKLALEHSRALFIYHAGQRIESLNRYFVTITVFLTGFGFLATSKLEPGERALFGIVLAFGGFYITHLFKGLDKRNEQLVHCDESLLKYAEKTLASLSNPSLPEWEVTKRAGEYQQGVRHYADIVPYIFTLYKVLSIIGGVYVASPWARAALSC